MRTNLIKTEVKERKRVSKGTNAVDMVIAFDTTGSMRSYIDSVKKYVEELVPTLFKDNPNLRLGIVAFGDYCDMSYTLGFGKAYQVLPLTDNQQDIIEFIRNAQNTNGGDAEEFYELVIKKITAETAWREDSTKAVLLIADDMPHAIGYQYNEVSYFIDWREEAKKSAELGIKWDTMTIGTRGTRWQVKLSAMTNGVSVPFNNSSKTQDMIKVANLARSGDAVRYKATMDSVDDLELKAVYTAYSKEVF